jgi:transposase
MPKCKLCAAEIADVCARLIIGESRRSIAKLHGISTATMIRMEDALRKRGVTIAPPPKRRVGTQQRALLDNLLRTTSKSNREIAAASGVSVGTVSIARHRFNIELVQAGGELPRCDCGQYLHHPRLCWARQKQNMINTGMRSLVTMDPEMRADVRRRLLGGEAMRAVAEGVGLKRSQILSFVQTFTRDEREQRKAAFRVGAGRRRADALRRSITKPKATDPTTDPLYARISAAVPRAIDGTLRDDMISQAYLEVLEGRIKEDQLADGVKKVRGRIFQAFANPWGNLSLDVTCGDEGGRRMIERIPSETSAFA